MSTCSIPRMEISTRRGGKWADVFLGHLRQRRIWGEKMDYVPAGEKRIEGFALSYATDSSDK